MISALLTICWVCAQAPALPSWTFDADAQGWQPNQAVSNFVVKEGVMTLDATGSDPFLSLTGIEVPATPWQYVVIRMKADREGSVDFFWTGDTSGPNGGLSEQKKSRFVVQKSKGFKDYVFFPFWQREKTIRSLRFDVYGDTHFEVDSISVKSWDQGRAPVTDVFQWTPNGDVTPWVVDPASKDLFAPPLNLAVSDKAWVSVTVEADASGACSILWGTADGSGLSTADFLVDARSEPRTYNVLMAGNPAWHDGLAAFGIRLPEKVILKSIVISNAKQGPADVDLARFCVTTPLNRTGKPCRIEAEYLNTGAVPSAESVARLVLTQGLTLNEGVLEQKLPALEPDGRAVLSWTLECPSAGTQSVFLKAGAGLTRELTIEFTPDPHAPPSDYVPEPLPIKTTVDVCAYYFPGWDSAAKWNCIRETAPVRKPLLGYYDESNVECVDWQIRWAVENGITCFLVDWYWVNGAQSLTHWFDAYRQARYRDLLGVAIMWANHNPPGTNSPEDWRNVTREWINKYFNLPGYYRIDGKPAIFIWDPSLLRNDLKGSEAVKACLDESQAMARQAGYPGITFVAMRSDFSSSESETLAKEGYVGITSYHEFGPTADALWQSKRMSYSDLVAKAPDAWKQHDSTAKGLTYYPVVDTGWDSRPWHGDKASVVEGRNVRLWKQLLVAAAQYAAEKKKPLVILGPLNEWGEGSYIEPCAEFGFGMYDALRDIFGTGSRRRWVPNIGPSDIGRGPYDFAPVAPVSAWEFSTPASGWKASMGVADLRSGDGALRFRTATDDPALIAETKGINAEGFSKCVITMRAEGALRPGDVMQLFWAPRGASASESTSVRVPLVQDGQEHEYVLDLRANPQWRGGITNLRLDPCDTMGVNISITKVQLLP